MNSTNKLKAQIHIAKQQLGLDDDTYRALLKSATGKTSSANMGVMDLHKVIEAMKQRGFKVKRKLSPVSHHKRPGTATRVDKLRAIWISMAHAGHICDGSETALTNWVRSQIKSEAVDALEWLEQTSKANQVLERLKQWQKRMETKALNEDLVMIRAAIPALEQQGQSVTEAEAAQILLDHHVITWHELLTGLGLTESEHYETNRQHLRPLAVIVGQSEGTACN